MTTVKKLAVNPGNPSFSLGLYSILLLDPPPPPLSKTGGMPVKIGLYSLRQGLRCPEIWRYTVLDKQFLGVQQSYFQHKIP